MGYRNRNNLSAVCFKLTLNRFANTNLQIIYISQPLLLRSKNLLNINGRNSHFKRRILNQVAKLTFHFKLLNKYFYIKYLLNFLIFIICHFIFRLFPFQFGISSFTHTFNIILNYFNGSILLF